MFWIQIDIGSVFNDLDQDLLYVLKIVCKVSSVSFNWLKPEMLFYKLPFF